MTKAIIAAAVTLLLAACASQNTLGELYPAMYEEKPLSIAIMPPVNRTTHVEAKDYFYTTLYIPLCEKGYYVFPPYLTMDMFKQESAYDAELFIGGDLTQFRNVLGADALMFTIIKEWRRDNLLGKLSVDIEYILRSTKTGQTLYHKEGQLTVDTSVSGSEGGWGAVADILATALNTAATDKIVAGRKCNTRVLSDMPAGKYSPRHGKDAGSPGTGKLVKATVE